MLTKTHFFAAKGVCAVPLVKRRRERDDQYDPAAVREASRTATQYNPFASFFKEKDGGAEDKSE